MSGDKCGCYRCDDERRLARYAETGDIWHILGRFMIVCPECGNKRCPKATFHGHDCTGSNDTNQPGSRYHYGPLGGSA